MSEERKAYKIARGTYILDSSGTAPDGERMKQQADSSYRLVRELFDSGALKIISSSEGDVPQGKPSTSEKAGLKKKELDYQIIPPGEQEMADLRVLVDTVSQVTPKTDKDSTASEAA